MKYYNISYLLENIKDNSKIYLSYFGGISHVLFGMCVTLTFIENWEMKLLSIFGLLFDVERLSIDFFNKQEQQTSQKWKLRPFQAKL